MTLTNTQKYKYVLFLFCLLDPLEQFEIVSVISIDGEILFNNLGLTLLINTSLVACLLGAFNANITNNYDFIMYSLYRLVRGIVKENLSIYKQQYFTPIFFQFLTILSANLAGLLPYSFTITSSFVLTFFFSLSFFIGINFIGCNKHEWEFGNLFMPGGVPLAIAPFLTFIEAVSYFSRVLSLAIRLFANMMSGHALLKILISFSWTLLSSGSLMVLIAVLPWSIVTAVFFLELLIAFLQAYVFTILGTLYTNDVLAFHT